MKRESKEIVREHGWLTLSRQHGIISTLWYETSNVHVSMCQGQMTEGFLIKDPSYHVFHQIQCLNPLLLELGAILLYCIVICNCTWCHCTDIHLLTGPSSQVGLTYQQSWPTPFERPASTLRKRGYDISNDRAMQIFFSSSSSFLCKVTTLGSKFG